MKASVARKIASDMKPNPEKEEYEKVMAKIEQAALKSEYKMWYYKSIPPNVRKQLTKDGYKVGKEIWDRNESLTEISW